MIMGVWALRVLAVLKEYVDSGARLEETNLEGQLSAFLAGSFDLAFVHAAGARALLARPSGWEGDIPGLIARADMLCDAVGLEPVLVVDGLSAAQRRAFIEARRAFVCLSGDIYVPMLGLVLQVSRDYSARLRAPFSPAEQSVFLYCLYHEGDVIEQGVAAGCLGISAAGASRAFSRLSEGGLLEYRIGGRTGRKREYFVTDRRAFFEEGMRSFGSAVLDSVPTDVVPQGAELPLCGLSALARYSNLAEPRQVVLGMPRRMSSELVSNSLHPLEGYAYEVQILRYDPTPFVRNGLVDPITVMRSVPQGDERVSMAIDEMMGRFAWYVA